MAIAYDNAETHSDTTANQGSSTLSNFTLGSGSDRYVLVGVVISQGSNQPTVTGVTFNGVAMALVNSRQQTDPEELSMWWMGESDLPAGGDYDIVATYDGATVDYHLIGAISFTGVKDEAPEAASGKTQAASTAFDHSVTTLSSGAWVIDVVGGDSSSTWTADSPQVERVDNQATNISIGMSHEGPVSPPASTSLGWDASASVARFGVIAAIAPLATVSPGPLTALGVLVEPTVVIFDRRIKLRARQRVTQMIGRNRKT